MKIIKIKTTEQKKIEPLDIKMKEEEKLCDKVSTFTNGDCVVEYNVIEKIVTGIEKIPDYKLYDKINEIIAYINSKEKEEI